ncbi:unnamed protein product [Urochloa decumbens]|uniref:RING-type E3 ubiquitin transferase n=1 Tax=Urochloa decumbens TaxID=240449 RepID=A0ABC8V9G4_9POAL
MRVPASLLRSAAANPSPPPLPLPHAQAGEQQAISVDSDTVVILASLLCALICVAGLALVARCTCRRRSSSTRGGGGDSSLSSSIATQPPRGLKKAAIEALPTVSLEGTASRRGEEERECAICLAVFAEGDELRLLPHCAHSFHAACIDTWLASHASCPSCRATVITCRRCGAACGDGDLGVTAAVPPPAAAGGAVGGGDATT